MPMFTAVSYIDEEPNFTMILHAASREQAEKMFHAIAFEYADDDDYVREVQNIREHPENSVITLDHEDPYDPWRRIYNED